MSSFSAIAQSSADSKKFSSDELSSPQVQEMKSRYESAEKAFMADRSEENLKKYQSAKKEVLDFAADYASRAASVNK